MTTLQPVLQALGYRSSAQQLAFVKLLQVAVAYGRLPGVEGVLTDAQAQAVLNNVEFESPRQAAEWLHSVTQEKMLRTPGKERFQCTDNPELEAKREQIMPLLCEIEMIEGKQPKHNHYDHVLVLGAMEPAVENRLDVLHQVYEQGTTVGRIHLLGSERPLIPEREPDAARLSDKTEMGMMEDLYIRKSAQWPKALQNVPVTAVDTKMKPDGTRPGTADTVAAWLDSGVQPGRVLVISNQPYAQYQGAAVKSVLPAGFQVETIGSAVESSCVRMSVACDSIARQVDANMGKLMERLRLREDERDATPDIIKLKPSQILSDPGTYQFRGDIDKTGITHKYRDEVRNWDNILHGDPLLVHQRNDGSYYVADGHHRLDLAKRMDKEGKGPEDLAVRVLREADGYSAKDAKIIAAYKNIAHGHCNMVDAAKVLKEARSADVHQELLPKLPMDRGTLRQAEALSKLSDEALAVIERGDVPLQAGIEVAKRVSDPVRQLAVLDIVREKLASPEMQLQASATHHTQHSHEQEGALKAAIAPIAHIREGHIDLAEGRKFQFRDIEMQHDKPSASFAARIEQEKLHQRTTSSHLAI